MEVHSATGLSSRKILMWTFIGSECMLFGSLITTYLVYRGKSVVGPYPEDLLNIPFITVTTFVLLMSSLMMVLALAAVQRGDMKWGKVWLFMTAFLGMVFLGGQVFEFTHFVHEGLHGAHVAVGVIWLLSLFFLAQRGRLTQANAETVEIAGLYWHFVDVVWIVLFTLIYLLV